MTRFSLLVSLAVSACLNSACFTKTSPEIPIYRKASYQVRSSLLPIDSVSTADHAISSLMYEGLFTVNQYLEVTPVLADTWSLDESGRIYEFKIKRGVHFHDGTVLTAEDVAASLRRLTLPGSPVRPRYERIRRITVTGPDSLKIELSSAYPPFISLLAAPSARVFKSVAGQAYPVGTGAFSFKRLLERPKGKVLVLERFDRFHGEIPNIRHMEVWELPEKEAFEKAGNGFIHDTVLFSYAGSGKIADGAKATVLTRPAAVTWIISFNNSKGATASRALRHCLVSRFDRKEFIRRFVPHHQEAIGFLPPTLMGSGKVHPGKEPSDEECRSVTGGTLTLDFPQEVDHAQEMCAYMAEQFAKAGAKVICSGMPFENLLKRITEKKADLSFLSQTLDLPDPEYYVETFESGSVMNLANYRSPEFDGILARIRSEPDRARRSDLFAQLDQRLYDDAVTLNLSYPPQISYWHSCLDGMEISIAGESYVDYSHVRLRPDCKSASDFEGGL